MKKFLTSSLIFGLAISPVIADDTLYKDTNIGESCTTDFLGSSSGNAANSFLAQYTPNDYPVSAGSYLPARAIAGTICPAGSYCPGDTYTFSETTDQGIENCPAGFTLSATGASAQTECYRACTTSDVAHSASVSGGYYYGNNNQCSAESCVTGYHKYDPYAPTYEELITSIMSLDGLEESETKAEYPTYAAAKKYLEDSDEWNGVVVSYGNPKKYGPSANENLKSKVSSADYTIDGTGYATIGIDGNQNYTNGGKKQSDYGLTENGTWGISFSYGDIIGKSKCTATKNGEQWGTQGDPDATTSGEAKYCWCQGTGIKGTNGTLQSLASSWVFIFGGSASACARNCAKDCAYHVEDYVGFRAALFGSAGASAAICEANEITITWKPANGEADITNTCTYSGDITLPTAPTKTGYTFSGWKLVEPNNQ